MKLFNSHLSMTELADAADQSREFATDNDFNQHLSTCSHCAGQFAAVQMVIGTMRSDDSIAAPPSAMKFAQNIFRASQPIFAAPKTLFEQIQATLKLDLSTLTPAFGERSAGAASAERQMLLAAGDFDIELRIRQTGAGFAARGQVLGELLKQNYTIQIAVGGATFDSAVDEFGQFHFPVLTTDEDLQVSLLIN